MAQRALRIVCLLTVLVVFAAACEWDYPIWIPRSPDADAIYRFRKGDRFGYIDRQGKIVIPPTIDRYLDNSGDEFHDGRLQVGPDVTYMDAKGREISYPNLDSAWDYSEGLAAAVQKGQRLWGYINTDGAFVISPRFHWGPDDYVWPFSDELAKIEVSKRFGFIDHSGSFVIPPTLPYADSFHEGFARVVVEGPCVYLAIEGPCSSPEIVDTASHLNGDVNEKLQTCKVTFVDKQGKVISHKRYDNALYFREGFAPVLMGEKWGYVDRTGELTIELRFDGAEPFSDGVALVKEKGLYGFIDKQGAYVIRPQFKYAEDFSEGYAVVGLDAYTGWPVWYIDHAGKPAFHRKFAAASGFFKGLAHVKLLNTRESRSKERFEYLDHNGRTVFAYRP